MIYKTFVTPDIAKALNGAGIPIGGTTGAQINAGQIVTDLGWLQSNFIEEKIGAQLSTTAANANNTGPGLHGHQLNYVSVGTTQLSTTGTNTIPASPAPTFTLNVTNGGDYNEYDVGCKVSVEGLSDTGTSTIPETFKGQTTNCSVTLPSPPTPGTYQVTARVVEGAGRDESRQQRPHVHDRFQLTHSTSRALAGGRGLCLRVDNLNTTAGIVAIAAGAVAVVALGWSVGLTVAMRKLRAAQRAVLGDGSQDLVAHAAHLQTSFEALAQYVEDFGTRLDARMDHAEGAARRGRRAPRAGPLRRLRGDVGAPVDLDRAARRQPLRNRALLDPPPRHRAAVRQADP